MQKRILLVALVVASLVVASACASATPEPTNTPKPTETQTGELVGVKASFSLGEAMEGEIDQMDFWGVVIVELDDGSRVEAAVDEALAQDLRGGDALVIEAVEGSEMWKVVGLADEPGD